MTARPRIRLAVASLTLAAAALAAASCGDDPFRVRWSANPDTVLLYSMARPELNLPSAFEFRNRTRWRVETPEGTGRWDLALDSRNGELVFLPPGALGVESRAGIARFEGMSFADVTEAPADTALYFTEDPVPVGLGTTYAVRTNETVGGFFGTRCVYYAKLEPLEIDVAGGTLRFVFDGARACNNRSLVPPD